ncbi:hypothetical protein [Chelatococcus reniformis]|uniref:Uncharacterized protein n=1 Tax=Chelatococcus reniformis TaxID=1494448 RepID=A0A916XC77_9HYPH|nr:hypothetical protein [Chelatococcus reniformis]GGC61084.1 hypothetical protein GCM10010994_19580 [Chelatococcus reniformis]
MEGTIYSAWIGAVTVPPLAALVVGIATRFGPAGRPIAAYVALAVLVASSLAVALQLSFVHRPANLWWLLASYGAYCTLAAACFGIRPLWLRIPALLIAALPIAAVYLLATVGIMALAAIAADLGAPPRRTELMRSGLSCDVTFWGMVSTDSGYEVHLRRFWPPAPFIWRTVSTVAVNQTAGETELTCQTLLARYDSGR